MEVQETNAKSAIERIKDVLKASFGKEETKVREKFLSATLEDGTAVEIEPTLEVGSAMVVISDNDEVSPAPDGVHTLVSGEMITVVEGIITEIVEAEAETEEEMSEPTEPTLEQKVRKVVESTIKESHFAKEEAIQELKDEFTKQLDARMAKQEEQLHVVIMSCFEQFAKTPETEPTKKVKFNAREKKSSWADFKNLKK